MNQSQKNQNTINPIHAPPQGFAPPLFGQVLGLCLLILVLVISINTLLVLKAPTPKPMGYRLDEVTQALQGKSVRLQNGETLRAKLSPDAPEFVTKAQTDPIPALSQWLRQDLAKRLHVDAARITVRVHPLSEPQQATKIKIVRLNQHTKDRNIQINQDNMGITLMDVPPLPSPPEPPPVSPPVPPPAPPQATGKLSTMIIQSRLGFDLNDQVTFPPFSAALRLEDGHYWSIEPPKAMIAPWQWRLLIGFGITALIITPIAYALSRSLVRPVTALAKGAETLGFEAMAPPLKSDGPLEVRNAALVLNRMQGRIKKQIDEKTALMAAIAHDLKTPLARMRLRIEALPKAQKTALSQDIAHMDALIQSAMAFASSDRIITKTETIDLSALIEGLCDDLSALYDIQTTDIPDDIRVFGETMAIKRILTNLIDNAMRYAANGAISLTTDETHAHICVIDHGEGIPEQELESVFEPFYRLETSRNQDTGGMGLGLSLARKLAQSLGGTLGLSNRYKDDEIIGLEARLSLPLATVAHLN